MNSRFTNAWVVLVIAANAGTVLLFSGSGPVAPAASDIADTAWHPALAFAARCLTLPIATPGVADVRDVIAPAACGIALLGFGIAGLLSGRDDEPKRASKNPATRWLVATAGVVLLIAVLSTYRNHTLGLSWGWIVRFASGATWAVLVARAMTARRVRQCVAGLLVVGLVCLLLSVAHRGGRHLAHFTWPIGPITSTAAFAALWAAMAGAVALHRRLSLVTLLAAGVCVVSVYVLVQTGRRGPALGLVGALTFIAVMLLRGRLSLRAVKIAIPIVAILGAGAYVAKQHLSDDRATSGTLALRFEYWRLAAHMIGESPSLGTGPDVFVVEMTNAVAPLRAAAPRFYHGNIDPYAHNEWIQAAVELGIPGGLLYFALPIGVLVLAARRRKRRSQFAGAGGNGDVVPAECAADDTVTLALSAGLVALLIIESGSIMLRTPLMPMWYWTLLGLLAAMCRTRPLPQSHSERPTPEEEPRASARADVPPEGPHTIQSLRSPAAIACGAVFLFAAWLDMTHATAQTDPATATDSPRLARLYADKTLSDRRVAALLVSRAADRLGDPAVIKDAAERWRALHALVPDLHDTTTRYASALLRAGDADHARRVLERALLPDRNHDARNPYDRDANVLYAKRFTDDAETKLRCVQRALRSAALDDELAGILTSVARSPAVRAILDDELPPARKRIASGASPQADDCGAELIRISALLADLDGLGEEALTEQRIAAHFYQRLEQTNDRYRRGHDAETDGPYRLARMLYDADPGNYVEAYEAIVAAERYAILGMPHESVADPRPEDGFVIGEVVPTVAVMPEELRPLWRLSSLLHLMTGNERHLNIRIMFYLPPEQWNSPAINRELARLVRQAYADLSVMAEDKRPAHYDQLLKRANRYDPGNSSPRP